MLALILGGIFCVTGLYSQIDSVKYQLRYNTTTCRYDAYVIFTKGFATTAVQRTQFNAQFSVVVPTGSTISVAQNFMPLTNNSTYSGTIPLKWVIGSIISNPNDGRDYVSITPTLSPTAQYNNINSATDPTRKDSIRVFSLAISPVTNCGEDIFIFRNGIDPGSNADGMNGGDFSNGFTIGNVNQRYNGNVGSVKPPKPTASAIPTCNSGLEIDLNSTTSTCQSPLTYSWVGPNGFSASTQDVNIPNATSAANGTYMVTVTDAVGCSRVASFDATSKPQGGADLTSCAGQSTTLTATSPSTGTWSSAPTNPSGASLGATSNGSANVTFSGNAGGLFQFLYTVGPCSDTVIVNVSTPDGGDDPNPVSCFSSGNATLTGVGTGLWTVDPSSPGTAVFGNPIFGNTTVSNFSAPGTYILNWTVNGCTDQVTVIVGSNCSCAIASNVVAPLATNSYCGLSGPFFLDGQNATPAGGTYSWEYSLNNGTYAPADGTNNGPDYSSSGFGVGTHRLRRIYSLTGSEPCSDTSNVILIEVAPVPSVPVNLTANPNPACVGDVVNLNLNSVSGVVYSWLVSPTSGAGLALSSSSTNTMTPTASGSYIVSVTATLNACTSNAALVAVVVGNTPYTPNQSDYSFTNPSSCGSNNGTISIAGFTPNTPITINFRRNGTNLSANVVSNSAGIITLSNLQAGVYDNFVFVGSGNCSSGTSTALVTLSDPSAPPAPSGLTAAPNPTCLGPTINLSVTNTSGAQYTWSVSAPAAGIGSSTTNTNSLNPTASGFYTVSVTQTIGGCVSPPATVGVSINPTPPTPNAGTVSSVGPTACGGSNGSISLSGYTPNTLFTINYSKNGVPTSLNITANGSGTIIIPNLSTGTYSNFQITNVTACSSGVFAGPVTLSDPSLPPLPSNLTATPNPVCLGTAVALSVTNNTGATYTWSASSSDAGLAASITNTNTMNALVPGQYTISVTQTVAGCTSQPASVSVNVQNAPPTPNASTVLGTNPTTCGGTNGFITLSGLMASTTYTVIYRLNGNVVNNVLTSNSSGVITISNLASGTYSDFAIRNAAGCTSGSYAGPLVLTDPGSPSAPAGLNANPNPICLGSTVNLSVLNTAGSVYNWSAPAGSGIIASSSATTTMLPTLAGSYVVSVTQAQGSCVSPPATVTVVVNPRTALPSSITPMNPSVCGGADGSIWLNGLTPNTSYTINYSRNGANQTVTVTSNASGVASINNLSAGTYNGFILTGPSGCPSSTSPVIITLSDPNSPSAPLGLTANPNPVCLGTSISLSVSNNPGASYTWSASNANAGLGNSTSNTTTMNASVAGNYTISVIQNVAGCSSPAANINVVVNPLPPTPSANNINSINPTCAESNGTITIRGYTPNQSYIISFLENGTPSMLTISANANGDLQLENLAAGAYSNFIVTNASNCQSGTFAGPIILTSPGIPSAPTGITTSPNLICLKSVVNIQVNQTSGATYNWSASSPNAGIGTSSTNSVQFNPIAAGSYKVSVTQTINGCTSLPATTSFEVRGDCYNPDFDVTWVNVSTSGSVKTNDMLKSSIVGTAMPFASNPSSCVPSVMPDGNYTFLCNIPGVYRYNVPVCLNSSLSSCENVIMQITVLDFVSNNPPVANHDYARTKQNVPVTVNFTANDRCESFPNCSLGTPTVIAAPLHGTFNPSTRTYTPNDGYIGEDSIRYEVCQSPSVTPVNCAQAYIYITVIGDGNSNITNAMDDYGQTPFNTTLTVSSTNGLKANDTDPENHSQSISPISTTIAGKGSININADGSYVFMPVNGFSGPVFIPYQTCDVGNPTACDSATLHILVERFNPVGTIGNFVWHDLNGDGIQGSSEPGVPGVKVFLLDDNDIQVAMTTTNASGEYLFNNVTAGRYYLKFAPPSQYSFINHSQGTDPSKDSDVTNQFGIGTTSYVQLVPGQQLLTVDAGVYICSKIGDRVWYDKDKDNIWDANENGINSLVVQIWRKYGNQWVFFDNTLTGKKPGTLSTDGWWNFCVPPGEYYVLVSIPPVGLVPALPNRGNNPLIDSDITGTFGPGSTRSFTVSSGQNKLDLGAGFHPMASTGNLVWIDNNFNGIQESGEPPLSNVVVAVYDASTNEMINSTTTSAAGTYNLDYLQQKQVYLKFNVPSGYIATRALATNDDKDSDVDHSNGINTTRKIELESGKSNVNIDLGVVYAPLPVNWGYVRAIKKSDHHTIQWGTVSESNSDYFSIERSFDGAQDWVSIGTVKAAGNSSINLDYSLNDMDIARFGTYYYRVKQFDLDGKFIYSNVVSLRTTGKPLVKLYPSPAKTNAQIDLTLSDISLVKIELFDAQGRLISIPRSETSLEAGNYVITLPLENLVNGAYVVNVTIDGDTQKLKLIKVE